MNLNLILAIIGGAVGLIITVSAVVLVLLLQQRSKQGEEQRQAASAASSYPAAVSMLLQWTFFDYALIGVFAIGSLFLFTDVVAVIRDAESYPLYHYGYLLCGFVFTLLGMLFMVFRLAMVLSFIRSRGPVSAQDHHSHPDQADQSEQRV